MLHSTGGGAGGGRDSMGSAAASSNMNSTMNVRQETIAFLLRGFLPTVSLQSELPNGQCSKESVYESTISALESIIPTISDDLQRKEAQERARCMRSPPLSSS
eukprot:9947167-Ditylum_brightwellii.AAC.1